LFYYIFIIFYIERCKNDCSGNGECDTSNYQCNCAKDFWGDDCSKELCPKKCSVKFKMKI
jgi:hypothetical protein